MVSFIQLATTPLGSPDIVVSIPVAPVVERVNGVKDVFIHKVGEVDAGEAVLSGVTVIVPVAPTDPQPPVNGML